MSNDRSSPRRRHRWAVLAAPIGAVAIVILGAFLRFEGLGRDSLTGNEPMSLQYAQWPISHPKHWNNGMALYHSVLHGWIRVAGESEAALRFPSALFGVAAIALMIALVRRINGWTTAVVAGLMLTLAWNHIYCSQLVRSYALFIMLVVLSTLLLVRLLERPGAGRLVAYGVALVALSYSHYQWIFVLVFHNLAVLFSRRRVGWGWLALHAVVIVAYVPQVVLGILPKWGWSPVHMPKNPSVFLALGAVQHFLSLAPHQPIVAELSGGRDVNLVGFVILPAVAAAGVVAAGVPIVLRRWPGLRTVFPNLTRYVAPSSSSGAGGTLAWLPVAWFGAVFILPFAIARTGKPVFHYQYVVGAMPAYCWLIGLAVAALPHRWLRLAFGVLCPLLAVPALVTTKVLTMREDWRGCAHAIAAEERPGDHIVVSPGFADRNFNLYYHGSLPTTSVAWGHADEEITKALGWAEPPQRVWLVVGPHPSRSATLIDYFKARADYRLTRRREQEFYRIILLLFEHTPQSSSLAGSGDSIRTCLRSGPGGRCGAFPRPGPDRARRFCAGDNVVTCEGAARSE